MAVEIRPSVLREQIENGMKKKELAEFYELPMTQMTKVLQQLGLRIKQNHLPKFVIVEEDFTEEVQLAQDMVNSDSNMAENVEIAPTPIEEPAVTEVTESEW